MCVSCCRLASQTACRLDYPIANPTSSIHPCYPIHTHFLLSFFCFLPSSPSLHSPSSDYCSVYQSFERLTTRPRVRSHSPHQAKKKPIQILPGKLPAHALSACVWMRCPYVHVGVGACCVSQAAYRNSLCTKILSFPPSLAIVPCSVSSDSVSLPWSVSDLPVSYIVKNVLLCLCCPAVFSSGKLTHAYTGPHCPAFPYEEHVSADRLLVLGGTLIPGAALCRHLTEGIEQ